MKKQIVIHPVLFAIYPVLFLYGENSYLYPLSVIVLPAAVSALVALGCWTLLRRWLGDWRLAAVPISAAFLIFTSFGAIFDQAARYDMRQKGFVDGGISTPDLIVLGCLAAVLLACFLVFRFRQYLYEWTYLMNVVGTLLACLPLGGGIVHAYVTYQAQQTIPERRPAEALRPPADPRALPDIYYVVLDGYGRNDVLEQIYGQDNSYFTEFLESKGFYVASESHSNYSATVTSLSSALNMDYLHELVGEELGGVSDRQFVRDLVARSRVVESLREAGYSIVTYASEYHDILLEDPDLVIEPWWSFHPFHLGLLDMTPVPWVMARFGHPPLYDYHRARILYTLENMPRAAALPGPKFVFVHVLLAHPPFVFDEEGNPVQPNRRYNMMAYGDFDEYLAGYRNQLDYLNRQFMDSLSALLEASDETPVMIVHGDHGPASRSDGTTEGTDAFEAFSILNAYLLPDSYRADLDPREAQGESRDGSSSAAFGGLNPSAVAQPVSVVALDTQEPRVSQTGTSPYPSITPVNSFRVVLNRYLRARLPLLEDRSYFSTFMHPYDFKRIESTSLEPKPRSAP